MLDTLTIRPALPFDAEPLHAYLAAIAAEKLPVLFAREAPPAAERVAAMIARNTGDERYCLLLAVEDSGVAGMLDFMGASHAQQRHVGAIRHERAARSSAAAASAPGCLRTLYGFALGRGYRRLELDVFSNNKGAIGLYEREGFLHEGRRRGAVMVGEAEVDLLMMAKRI